MRPATRLALSGLVLSVLAACGAPPPAQQDETEAREKLGMEAPGKEQVWYLPAPLSTVPR